MKLVHKNMEHVLDFAPGCGVELVVENRPLFRRMTYDLAEQSDGGKGDWLLSEGEKPVEFSRYVDLTLQLSPFSLNRKSLLTKLCATLEQRALSPAFYMKTVDLLAAWERLVQELAGELPMAIDCTKAAVGSLLRASGLEVLEGEDSPVDNIFSYMELVRELDRERLFIFVNMRSYFSDQEVSCLLESACLHDFKVMLLESVARAPLPQLVRYTVDEDLCEF